MKIGSNCLSSLQRQATRLAGWRNARGRCRAALQGVSRRQGGGGRGRSLRIPKGGFLLSFCWAGLWAGLIAALLAPAAYGQTKRNSLSDEQYIAELNKELDALRAELQGQPHHPFEK